MKWIQLPADQTRKSAGKKNPVTAPGGEPETQPPQSEPINRLENQWQKKIVTSVAPAAFSFLFFFKHIFLLLPVRGHHLRRRLLCPTDVSEGRHEGGWRLKSPFCSRFFSISKIEKFRFECVFFGYFVLPLEIRIELECGQTLFFFVFQMIIGTLNLDLQ